MIPLTISMNRMYYLADPTTPPTRLQRSPLHTTTSLAACDIRTGELLYSTHLLNRSPGDVPTADFKILHLQGREYIIHLSSWQEFGIIDGSTGHTIQRLKYAGAKVQDIFPKANSSVFALWSPPRHYDELPSVNYRYSIGLIHTFTLQPDKTFALTDLTAMEIRGFGTFIIHPFTRVGFQMDDSSCIRAITFNRLRFFDCGSPFDLGAGVRVRVNAKYRSEYLYNTVTLPPGPSSSPWSPMRRGYMRVYDVEQFIMLDETRIFILSQHDRELSLLYFGTSW
jgi:hypothetical protein